MLNATDTTNGYTMDKAQIAATPLATGSFTQLAILAPGVSSQFIAGVGTNQGLGNQNIWANGQRATSNTMTLNGIDVTNMFNGNTASEQASQRYQFNIGEGNSQPAARRRIISPSTAPTVTAWPLRRLSSFRRSAF